MKAMLIFLLAWILSGCATTAPLSVEELRDVVRSGPSTIRVEEFVVKRPFVPTYNALQINAERCFEVTVTKMPGDEPGSRPESMRYRSESLMTSETTAETILQLDKRGKGKMPEGGYYVLLADVEAMSSDETRLIIYKAMGGYDNINESLLSWAKGSHDECPRFPMGALDWTYTYHNP